MEPSSFVGSECCFLVCRITNYQVLIKFRQNWFKQEVNMM